MSRSFPKNIIVRLSVLLVVFLILRLTFIYFNRDLTSLPSGKEWVNIFYWGFRFDLFTIILFNLPLLIIKTFLDTFFENRRGLKKLDAMLFSAFNIALVIPCIADIGYYRFNGRRATKEVFQILEHSSSAFSSFILEYWLLLICFILFSILIIYSSFHTAKYNNPSKTSFLLKSLVVITILSVFSLLNPKRPIQPKTATYFVEPTQSALITNTALTLTYSMLKKNQLLKRKNYMADFKALQHHQIHHRFQSDSSFINKNVVIFVLESFSKEYLMKDHPNKAYTPFLDSLKNKSIAFENAYANGTTSSYGLMSILGGIPPFMNEPYFSSAYSENKLLGIGTLLKKMGYTNSFFFGAEDDHYGFKKNMALLGIDNYFSQKDYGDMKDHDGAWGIYDEEFFLFASEKIKRQQKPFFATIFNLSSHYPYNLPTRYKDFFPKGPLPSHESISYVDHSLKHFFKSIQNEEWYKNTLFIFTADHWAKIIGIKSNSMVGIYQIPTFIFDPANDTGTIVKDVFQQLDIVPTLLDLLSYTGGYTSFGSSVFKHKGYKYTFNEFENVYQIIDSAYVLVYDENKEVSVSLHNYLKDPNLENNLLDSLIDQALKMEEKLKAVIQVYNNSLIDNTFNSR